MRIRLEIIPRDLWVGIYSRATPGKRFRGEKARNGESLGFMAGHDPLFDDIAEAVTKHDIWICILPMVPIHLTWFRPRKVRESASDLAARICLTAEKFARGGEV